jgi:hypothetical protein
MAFLSFIQRQAHWIPSSLFPRSPDRDNEGQESKGIIPKEHSGRDSSNFYCCKEVLNVIRAQSCLSLLTGYEETQINQDTLNNPQPRTGNPSKTQPSLFSCDSCDSSDSLYSSYKMDEPMLKRTRAKTPVYSIGQLESARHHPFDATQLLAEHYRALLPARMPTPFVEPEPPKIHRKTLRKIKRQQSLRNLMKQHSRSSSISDSETLVGSDSPTSPLSPSHPLFDLKQEHALENNHVTAKADDDLTSSFENDMALKICMDLLTSELATAFSRQHPLEKEDRSSGLQVLLMIEAYETVQQHLRQRMYKSHVMGEKDDHVQDVERILEYWLKVLYSVYDRSHEINSKGNEECFPRPLSLSNSRPHV